MTKTLNATFAAALIAATAFGGSVAFAGGDYYQGVSPDQSQARHQQVDRFTTQSISNGATRSSQPIKDVGPAEGDYYQGVSKN